MKALITGASSGIGRDIAKVLSKKGYELILVARDKEKLEKVESEIETKVRSILLDLSVEENCKKLYEEVKEENIDLLINNAGFGVYGKFTDTELEKEVNMIHTNIIAVHILLKLFLGLPIDDILCNKLKAISLYSLDLQYFWKKFTGFDSAVI